MALRPNLLVTVYRNTLQISTQQLSIALGHLGQTLLHYYYYYYYYHYDGTVSRECNGDTDTQQMQCASSQPLIKARVLFIYSMMALINSFVGENYFRRLVSAGCGWEREPCRKLITSYFTTFKPENNFHIQLLRFAPFTQPSYRGWSRNKFQANERLVV